MKNSSKRLNVSLIVGLCLTVAAGIGLAIEATLEERAAAVRSREELEARYGKGSIGEGRGSEYNFAGAVAINSILAGVFIMPLSFVIGGGLSALVGKSDPAGAK